MKEPEDAKTWLSKITKDQNLEDLDNILLTRWDGFRRWFASRIILPVVSIGKYNTTTGLVEFHNDYNNEQQYEYVESTTSAALYTLTSGATERIVIHFASSRNSTRGHAVDVTAAGVALIDGGGGVAQNRDLPVIGGTYGNATNPDIPIVIGPIKIQETETFTITDLNFVAADAKSIKLVITRETVA